MLDPNKEGKIQTCILAKRHLSILLLHNYSSRDNTAVSLELQRDSTRVLSAYLAFEKENPSGFAGQRTGRGMRKAQERFGNRL